MTSSRHLAWAPLLFLTCCGERAPNVEPRVSSTKSDHVGLDFAVQAHRYAGYMPAVADLDLDGNEELLGTVSIGNGTLVVLSPESQGLAGLFEPGRVHRDARLADLDGDGYPDLIANTYSPVTDKHSTARLYVNNGDLTFRERLDFRDLGIRGFGETILVADFDNDEDVDVFIPYYSFNDPGEQCYFLINDGTGAFVDRADHAGVAMRKWPRGLRPEGAQAVDFDDDGFIDIYVASHFFRNNGDLTFTDIRAALCLPLMFDEGIKFLDWNNDGLLDLVVHNPARGPALFEFDGKQFVFRDVIPPFVYVDSFGLNIGDLNNDGREDLAIGNIHSPSGLIDSAFLLNHPSGFLFEESPNIANPRTDLIALADLDADGRIDVFRRSRPLLLQFHNQTRVTGSSVLRITVLGSEGQRNQYGRVVRIHERSRPEVTYTRVVDGGSGYLSQNAYELVVPVPTGSIYDVEVAFPSGFVGFSMGAGEGRRVYADGRVQSY